MSSTPSILGDRHVRRLWAAVELTYLGVFLHVVAASWVMTGLTAAATPVALIQSAQALPIVIFALFAGVLADLHDRRLIMLAATCLSLAGSLLLVALSGLHLLAPASLLGLVFVLGSGMALFTPAWLAALGDLVPRDRITDAVSLHNIGANLMRTVGPALGGLAVTFLGATATFLLATACFLPACVTILHDRRRRAAQGATADSTPEPVMAAFRMAFRFMAVSPHLTRVLWRSLVYSCGGISTMSLLPLVARDQFGLGPGSYGAMLGGFGLGAIGGGLALRHLRRRAGDDRIIRVAFGVNAGAVVALALSPTLALGMAAIVVAGGAWLVSHAVMNSRMQMAVPRWIAGRVVAMVQVSAYLGIALGGWAWGSLVELADTRVALAGSGAVLLAALALALRHPLPPVADMAETAAAIAMPASVGKLSGDGPVQVFLDYRIAADDLARFRAIMAERRRHLTRLGAMHWQIMQDVAAPTDWTETFVTATAADYRRLMTRRTAETVALRDALAALHGGAEPPRVRLMQHLPQQPAGIAPSFRA